MRHNIEDIRKEPVFKPFKLTIEVTTPQELSLLYGYFNTSSNRLESSAHGEIPIRIKEDFHTHSIWEEVNKRCTEYLESK